MYTYQYNADIIDNMNINDYSCLLYLLCELICRHQTPYLKMFIFFGGNICQDS